MEPRTSLAERAQTHTLVGAGLLGFTGVLGMSAIGGSILAIMSVVLVGAGGAGLLVLALMGLVRAQTEAGGERDDVVTSPPVREPERVG